MSNDSQESPCSSSRPRLYPSVLTQMQIERLKREDEEEHWISGEELYTEGSSDDEEDRGLIGLQDAKLDPQVAENLRSTNTFKMGGEHRHGINRSRIENASHLVRTSGSLQNPNSCTVLKKKLQKNDHHQTDNSSICETDHSAASISTETPLLDDQNISSLTITDHYNDEKTETARSKSSATTFSSTAVKELDKNDSETENLIDDHQAEGISWRPKRGSMVLPKLVNFESNSMIDESSSAALTKDYKYKNLMYEETIVELRDLQFEYKNEILDSLADLKKTLIETAPPTSNYNSLISADYIDPKNLRTATYAVRGDLGEEKLSVLSLNDSCNNFAAARIIEDISFNDTDVDRWSNEIINTAQIKKGILNMVKLDTCIDKLYEEVKKAREETLRHQILNREKLKKLQNLRPPESGRLAKNSTQFFQLCNRRCSFDHNSMEIENNEGDEIVSSDEFDDDQLIDLTEDLRNEGLTLFATSVKDESGSESRELQREMLEEELRLIEKRKLNFIERNKELASCAMGTLAITDEEKKKLKKLVEEGSSDEEKEYEDKGLNNSAKSSSTSISTPYTIDRDADELLKNLTEQIENINSETYRKSEKEGHTICREEFLPQKEIVLLNSLRILAESNSKVIQPISEEEIRELINEYYSEKEETFKIGLSSDPNSEKVNFDDETKSTSTISDNLTITKKKIEELVKEAKTTMPFFKFKNQIQNLDEPEDGNDKQAEHETSS